MTLQKEAYRAERKYKIESDALTEKIILGEAASAAY